MRLTRKLTGATSNRAEPQHFPAYELSARLGIELRTQQGRQSTDLRRTDGSRAHWIEFIAMVDRHEMNVRVRYGEPFYGNTYTLRVCDTAKRLGYARGDAPEFQVGLVRDVKQIVRVILGNEEKMPQVDLLKRKEGDMTRILIHLRRRQLPGYD